MANQHPTRTGKYTIAPTLDQIVTQRLHELEILRLTVEEGLSGSEIGRRLGIHKATVTKTLQRVFARNEAPLVEQKRAAEHATLMAARAVLLRVMLTPHVHVSDGQIVRDEDGTAIVDDGPNVAAARALVANVEQVSKLWGLNAPTRKVIEVLTEDITDAAIRALEAELEANDADLGSARPGAAGQAAPIAGPATPQS